MSAFGAQGLNLTSSIDEKNLPSLDSIDLHFLLLPWLERQ
jgi:hypothetical protein